MGIETIFANVSCRDLAVSKRWYEKLFGRPPVREPMPGLAEWQLTDSAEMQLNQAPEHAGHSTLTLGVLPMEPEHARLTVAGLDPGPVEETPGNFFICRLNDPDGNLVVLASARQA